MLGTAVLSSASVIVRSRKPPPVAASVPVRYNEGQMHTLGYIDNNRGSPPRTFGNGLGDKGHEIIHRQALHRSGGTQDERQP